MPRIVRQLLTVAVAAGILIGCTWWLSSLSHRSGGDDVTTAFPSTSPAGAVTASASSTSIDDMSGSPEDAVRAYYGDLNAKNYQAAYALLSSAEQQRHPFSAFVAYQEQIDATVYKITGTQAGVVTLVVGEHHVDDPKTLQEFSGTWYLTESSDPGHWILDSAAFSSPRTIGIATATPR